MVRQIDRLQRIPGIGPSIAADLHRLGTSGVGPHGRERSLSFF